MIVTMTELIELKSKLNACEMANAVYENELRQARVENERLQATWRQYFDLPFNEDGFIELYALAFTNHSDEVARLRARIALLETAGQEIYLQLGYFMESDSCPNDPYISWPDVCEEGCAHCSAEYDRDVWRKAMEASK